MEHPKIIRCDTLEPTKEELEKINELKFMLKDHLMSPAASSLSEPVRQALAQYSTDQDVLLKFVRGRKLHLPKCFDSVISFANVKYSVYPELFPSQVPDFVRHAVKNEVLTVLKDRDALERTVVILRASKWDPNVISSGDIIGTGVYLADSLMNLPEFLRKGVILLIDANGASLNHAKHFTLPAIAKFINVFWQAYPIQIKGIYIVNAPFFARPLYALIKPLVPTKLRERVLITPGIKELSKRIEPYILPKSLGGHLSEEEAFSLSFLQLPD